MKSFYTEQMARKKPNRIMSFQADHDTQDTITDKQKEVYEETGAKINISQAIVLLINQDPKGPKT